MIKRLLIYGFLLLPVPLLTWLFLSHFQPTSMETIRHSVEINYGYWLHKEKRYREAFQVWRPHAERGDAKLQLEIAHMLTLGMGVEKNQQRASHWYRQAAEQGLAPAMFYLGSRLIQGQGVHRDAASGLDWIRQAADKGLALAQWTYAKLYHDGRLVPKDSTVALKWATKLEATDHADGTNLLALLHLRGEATPQDAVKGVALLRKAARLGAVDAKLTLGALYYNGMEGLPKSHKQALPFYLQAAETGHAEGLFMSGHMLVTGEGAVPDPKRGIDYMIKAAKKGHQGAKQALKVLQGVEP